MRYLPVNVYTNNSFGDCTNNGVTFTDPDKLVVPCEDGFLSDTDVDERGYIVLLPDEKGGVRNFVPETEQYHNKWTMMGGNFVYSSDSRFSRAYGHAPVAVHDRIEA